MHLILKDIKWKYITRCTVQSSKVLSLIALFRCFCKVIILWVGAVAHWVKYFPEMGDGLDWILITQEKTYMVSLACYPNVPTEKWEVFRRLSESFCTDSLKYTEKSYCFRNVEDEDWLPRRSSSHTQAWTFTRIYKQRCTHMIPMDTMIKNKENTNFDLQMSC